jgi:hypothetical protein
VKDCLVSEGMTRSGELNKTTTILLATRGPSCSFSLAYEEISIRCNQQSVRFLDGNHLKSVSWAQIESVSSVKHCTFGEQRVRIVKCKLLWGRSFRAVGIFTQAKTLPILLHTQTNRSRVCTQGIIEPMSGVTADWFVGSWPTCKVHWPSAVHGDRRRCRSCL